MTYFIEPQDELAAQVLPVLQQIQEDHGPETMVSPRGEIITTGQDEYVVVYSVSVLDEDFHPSMYEWGYVPVWAWLEEYFCDH